jgi:enoyl-[acyl-carrier protein] reductase II
LIHQILPAAAIMQSLIEELEQAFARLRAMQP